MSKQDWKTLSAYRNTGLTPEQVEELKKKKAGEPETTVYDCTDPEHDAYVCRKCGHIENFEADGPEENGWGFCPGCGRLIVPEKQAAHD